MLVGLRPLDVLVDCSVQPVQKLVRIPLVGLLQRAGNGLDHQHQHAALEAMTGHVADADLDP